MTHLTPQACRRSGFTLIEIAIVFTIMGLVLGGVLVGRSLIKATEIKAVATEYQQFRTSIAGFKEQYQALPGDMTDAERYWGGPEADCTVASAGTATCNGDGNGRIDGVNEPWRAWQHLSNAELIDSFYNGAAGADPALVVLQTNAPRSKYDKAGWTLQWLGLNDGSGNYFAANYGNVLLFGMPTPSAPTTTTPVMPADAAFSVDSKLDDGLPHTGTVRALKNAAMTGCAVATDDAYQPTSETIGCALIFITGY